MTKPIVFISYNHKDKEWKNRLASHLGVLQSEGYLDIWDDRRIEVGEDWYPDIQKAISASGVAILLISADFLTSKFILGEEVPRLFERRETDGLRIFPVIVKPCAWQHVKWLARMQGLDPKTADQSQVGVISKLILIWRQLLTKLYLSLNVSPKYQVEKVSPF